MQEYPANHEGPPRSTSRSVLPVFNEAGHFDGGDQRRIPTPDGCLRLFVRDHRGSTTARPMGRSEELEPHRRHQGDPGSADNRGSGSSRPLRFDGGPRPRWS